MYLLALNCFQIPVIRAKFNLKKCLTPKVFFFFVMLGVKRHLQTQFATQHDSFLKPQELVHLGPIESDWSLLGSPHCVDSLMEVRQEGSVLEVRSHIRAKHYWCHVLTHMRSDSTIWHGHISSAPMFCFSLIIDSNIIQEENFILA